MTRWNWILAAAAAGALGCAGPVGQGPTNAPVNDTGQDGDSGGDSESDADADTDPDERPEKAPDWGAQSQPCPAGWSGPIQHDQKFDISRAEARIRGTQEFDAIGFELQGRFLPESDGQAGGLASGGYKAAWASRCLSGDIEVREHSEGIIGDAGYSYEVAWAADDPQAFNPSLIVAVEGYPGLAIYHLPYDGRSIQLQDHEPSYLEGGSHNGHQSIITHPDFDPNGDGIADLLIGASRDPTGGQVTRGDPDSGDTYYAGGAYLLNGPLSAALGHPRVEDAAAAHIVGVDPWGLAGSALAWIPDMNGDGLDEVVLGAPAALTTRDDAGPAYLVLGPLTGTLSLADADVRTHHEDVENGIGRQGSMAGGDFDGDGYGEWALGCLRCTGSSPQRRGLVFIYTVDGNSPSTYDGDDAHAQLEAPSGMAHQHGQAVVAVQDIDGDGRSDLLVGSGSGSIDDAGIFLVHGPFEGLVEMGEGRWIYDSTGESNPNVYFNDIGDIDNDGLSDLAFGSPHTDTNATDAGMISIVTARQLGY